MRRTALLARSRTERLLQRALRAGASCRAFFNVTNSWHGLLDYAHHNALHSIPYGSTPHSVLARAALRDLILALQIPLTRRNEVQL